ncbi:hypothetical protein CHLNCDRAFT_135165 [Chlorella variabilis]|uniref:Centrosomal protein of 44 kDa n=1 Tax=Chlorella variabilis TaxID=554065 RepID=E1ZHM5_CHLVA|nr:hypothetical protein CHLNCDRAFT_135165 [Chlorella variabilis]EFN54629.1 hypothetical protein CHLNCDRAFT_135165 [Chlorella variabilis]|eukprot:XP_005846731.1 hypothetical protein CHLNCDRAFT_135165 [Chlorella variabilis]
MATGDVRAAVAALESTLRSLRFTTLDAAAAEAGSPAPLLPALDYLLLRCSKHVALLVAQQGLQLHGKSDLRFVEGVFKFVRDALGIRSPLTPAQFLSEGFAERKVLLVQSIAKACKEHHNAAARMERLAALKGQHTEQRLCAPAAAPPEQHQLAQEQPGQPKGRASRGRCSSIPLPPPLPHVRVVSEHLKAPAAAAATAAGELSSARPHGLSSGDDGDSQSGSDAVAAAVTPTSVVAAAGAACQQRSKQQLKAAPSQLAPAASPIEQPRSLPPSLLLAQRQADSCTGGSDGCTWAQPGPGGLQEAAAGYAAAGGLQAAGAQQAGAAGQPAPPLCMAVQAMQQHPAVAGLQGAASGCEQQTWRLIQDLQLRLGLAEEASAAARQDAQQAREQLQARVTVLEGRVRFLEAGYELRPSQQQLQLACDMQLGQPQPALQLPWGAAARPPGQLGPLAGGGQHTRLNPLYDQQASSSSSAAAAAPVPAGAAAPPSSSSSQAPAAGGIQWPLPAAPAGPAGPAVPAAPAAVPAERSYGSTVELISGMQARFSEAQDFLLSLRRL